MHGEAHQGAMPDTDLLVPADDSTSTKPAKGPVLPANLEAEAALPGPALTLSLIHL